MKLKPIVTSYLGFQRRVLETLAEEHLETVMRIALGECGKQYDPSVLIDLEEMHIICSREGRPILNTAVFMKADILQAEKLASTIAKELGEQLARIGEPLTTASPEIRNFLAGTVGAAQGPSALLRKKGLQVNWKDYTGKFASTKTDFEEIFDGHRGPESDWQSKSTVKGERYSAVFIGPGGANYLQLFDLTSNSEDARPFRGHLMVFLTDSLADLIAGNLSNGNLERIAENFGLYENGQPKDIIVTDEIFRRYLPAVRQISQHSTDLYVQSLDRIFEFLRSTTSGRQGVAPENMMMHFARYCRRALADELYRTGFLTDKVRETGSITVFYENSIAELREFLV